jgi:hypothetical protein
VDWFTVPKKSLNEEKNTNKSLTSEGILIDFDAGTPTETPMQYQNVGMSLLDSPIDVPTRGISVLAQSFYVSDIFLFKNPISLTRFCSILDLATPPSRPPPTYLDNTSQSSLQTSPFRASNYGISSIPPPPNSANSMRINNITEQNSIHPKVSNLSANSYSSTRDIYQGAASLYSVNTVDSADWSQTSETYSEFNGGSSPDPFDTSKIVTPPTSDGSRYYSFVPHSPTLPDMNTSSESQRNHKSYHEKQTNGSAISDDGYGGSPALRHSTPEETSAKKPAFKPPLELLKKRDEAFSWLDDAIGGLHIGTTTTSGSKSGGLPSCSSDSKFDCIAQSNTLESMQKDSAQKWASSTLDSGDEVWDRSSTFNGSSANPQFQAVASSLMNQPFALPPPPSVSRNSSSPLSGRNQNVIRPVLPAYRPPPPPSADYNLRRSVSGMDPLSKGVQEGVNSLMQAVQILLNKVPTAEKEGIVDALKRSNGSIAEAERFLKVEELSK